MNQEANQLESQELKTFLDDTFDTMDKVLDDQNPELRQYEIGTVNFVGRDIARVGGLPHIRAEELVRFAGNYMGLVFNIDPAEIGVIMLDPSEHLRGHYSHASAGGKTGACGYGPRAGSSAFADRY